MNLLTKILVSASLLATLFAAFLGYRNHLISEGYNKALTEYRQAEERLVEKHNKEVDDLKTQTLSIQNAHKEKTNEVNSYRAKLDAASQRLREQQADTGRRVEEASCGSIRDYAKAVTGNLAEAREHIASFGLEAAECSATAETLKKALDLANGQGPDGAY
jgi:chromosome segregation ATPase